MRSNPPTASQRSRPAAFPAAFQRLVGAWLDAHPRLPTIASGMVGSRNGWREAPYVPCPRRPERDRRESRHGRRRRGARASRAGVVYEDEAGQPDVIRGEEVEILGVADAGAKLVVLPGSHSKWASVEAGRVLRFRTFATGELFAALKDHTLVGAFARAAKPKPPGNAFALGVRRGAAAARGEDRSGIIGSLFGARSLVLMRKLAEDDSGEYLSGLLIGAEIAEARRLFPNEAPRLAGAPALAQRYLAAFAALGQRAEAAPARAAARGLHILARKPRGSFDDRSGIHGARRHPSRREAGRGSKRSRR